MARSKAGTGKLTGDPSVTPLMRQYNQVKARYPDALLLFRVGDFYETFGEDAVKAAQALGIVLTRRNNGGADVELAGFPYHSLDTYLPKLVKAGYRVAICEQLEKPSKEKKIVQRGVTELITPGVAVDDKLLDHKVNNFLAGLYSGGPQHFGLAFLDLSTGEFLVSEGDLAHAEKLLQTFQPAEVLFSRPYKSTFQQLFGQRWLSYPCEDWIFQPDFGREQLERHFEVPSLKGFGIEQMRLAQTAAGALLHYLDATENKQVSHIRSLQRIHSSHYVWLDPFTIRNLELVQPAHPGGNTLLQVLDHTLSPMGARMLRKWVLLPLLEVAQIQRRQRAVQWFIEEENHAESLRGEIRSCGDLERLCGRIALGKSNPRELRHVAKALQSIAGIRQITLDSAPAELRSICEPLDPCQDLLERILGSLEEEAPANTLKGGYILPGVSDELDELRHLVSNSRQILLEIQQKEAIRSSIPNLKVGFNAVFGYYLEVTARYKDTNSIPADWIRKQTLTNGERYITEELKVLESRILGAEERMLELEQALFAVLLQETAGYIPLLQENSAILATLDCLLSLARVAARFQYTCPTVDDSTLIEVRQGRHPVIERELPIGESYVPNDVLLDPESQQMLVITGPNMSGKSALLRQTALITLMAQIGSFVPAASARIGIVDKIFTRVGASDNLSSGESTFMVEMNETASILNNMSARSLILLDEIGRGTSTYDGISIAWSIAEFLHDNPLAHPKTLFATHYHELNELAERHPRIRNYHVAVLESDKKIVFLRTLQEGGSQHSFGIHVARMAGMPGVVIERAGQILQHLETQSIEQQGQKQAKPDTRSLPKQHYQLNFFDSADPIAVELKELLRQTDVNALTPMDALLKLHEWSAKAKSDL